MQKVKGALVLSYFDEAKCVILYPVFYLQQENFFQIFVLIGIWFQVQSRIETCFPNLHQYFIVDTLASFPHIQDISVLIRCIDNARKSVVSKQMPGDDELQPRIQNTETNPIVLVKFYEINYNIFKPHEYNLSVIDEIKH